MAELKKVLITLPDSLLKEVDNIASIEKINRSEFVRNAMRLYLRKRRKIQVLQRMKKGYAEMADININISQVYSEVDNEQHNKYEQRLGELGRNW